MTTIIINDDHTANTTKTKGSIQTAGVDGEWPLLGWEAGRWYHFDDSSVQRCSQEDVASDTVPGSLGLPAILASGHANAEFMNG